MNIITQDVIIKAIVAGAVWGLTYLYIRRYLNPDTRDKYATYKSDAVYGALASAVAYVAKLVINAYV